MLATVIRARHRPRRQRPFSVGRLAWALAGAVVLTACGDDDMPDEGGDGDGSPQCDSNGYVAFDSANHEPQDRRLAAHAELLRLMTEAVDAEGEVDQDLMKEAAGLYTNAGATADLQEKVQERRDEHVDGDPLQGERMDSTLQTWLSFGARAETALEANLARQWVDKTLLEFFFLSVHHELNLGARDKWDEAFGYYGSGSDNDEDGLLGLATTAFSVDATNATTLGQQIFNDLIDGACELDTTLEEMGEDQVDLDDAPELADLVEGIDHNLQKVLAYWAGHEAFEMRDLIEAGAQDTDEITVEGAELIPLATPLLRIMRDRGGESEERADELEVLLEVFPVSDPETLELEDTDWIEDVDPGRIIELLEAEYDIEILG